MLVYIVSIQKKGSFFHSLFSYFKQSGKSQIWFFWITNTWIWEPPIFSFQSRLGKKLQAFEKSKKNSHTKKSPTVRNWKKGHFSTHFFHTSSSLTDLKFGFFESPTLECGNLVFSAFRVELEKSYELWKNRKKYKKKISDSQKSKKG